MINTNNANDIFELSLEQCTIYFLLTFLIGRIFFLIAEIISPPNMTHDACLTLWYIFSIFGVLQIFYILFKLLPFLGKQTKNFKFKVVSCSF